MAHSNASIQTPALRTVGNIATGDDKQTEAVIAAGVLPHLGALMRASKKGLRKEAVWTISNITAGTKAQIEAVKSAGILPELVRLLAEGEWEIKKEAMWAVSNYCSGGTKEQIRFLVRASKAMKPLCDCLTITDPKLLVVVLDALFAILKTGSSDGADAKYGETNAYTDMIEDCDGLDKIEELQTHANQKVYEKAVKIIEQFFSEEEAEENGVQGLAPNANTGSFQFDAGGFGGNSFAGVQNGFNFGSPAKAMQQQPAPMSPFQNQQGFGFGAPAAGGPSGFSF